MKPKNTYTPQDDLFKNRLENMIDTKHKLVSLSKMIDWQSFDDDWGKLFPSDKGAPAIPTRMIAGLHYLKHLYDLSDEQVLDRWVENPYWQYFCGEVFFSHKLPIHSTSMTKWRNRLGKGGVEKLLVETINTGLKSKTIKPNSITKITVDTTVQEKNITFPTDSKLLNKARMNLVKTAKKHNIKLRQNYNRKCKTYTLMAGRYAHAKQFKRMQRMNKKLKSRLGRIIRDIERQLPKDNRLLQSAFDLGLAQAKQLINQQQNTKNKLYSLHAPETECISKGKAHKKYEFGVKASIAITNKEGFALGAMSCPNNPYDGHTLDTQLQQVKQLIPSKTKIKQCFADRGYRGHGVEGVQVFLSGQKRGVTTSIKKALKRRSAIEPEIGHMKNDGRLDRNYLKGEMGDMLNVILSASGHNLRKILNKLAQDAKDFLVQILKAWFWLLTTSKSLKLLTQTSNT